MNKKRKYIPGWQLRQKTEDKAVRERATAALDAYYEKQKILDELQEIKDQQEQIKKAEEERQQIQQTVDTIRANNTDTTQNFLPDSVQQPQQSVQQPIGNKKQATESYGKAYTTESAIDYLKRTTDPNAFSDQFIRTPLDPDYADWAMRQAIRAAENPNLKNDPASIAATAAMKLQDSFLKDDLIGKETAPERMSRRIRENSMFGTVDQKKALTPTEKAEIVQFYAYNDPLWGAKYLNDVSENINKGDEEEIQNLQNVKEPENYISGPSQLNGLSGGNVTLGMQTMLAKLANSLWTKSFLSDFILKTNDSQMKTSIGQIQRSNEFVNLSNQTINNVDLIEKLANNIRQLRRFDDEAGSAGISSLSPEKRNLYATLLDENRKIRASLDESDWWKNANNLASWAPTKTGYIAGMIDKVVDDDIGGVRNGLYGLDDKLDSLQKLLHQSKQDDNWLEGVTGVTGKIKKQLTEFNANNAEKQKYWRDQALTDLQDIVDWKTGNNWLNMKANVDPYYKAQETLLEKSGFKWNDPVKMAQFGWSGVAGGSNSSWWKSIISIGSKGAGIIGGAMTTGGTSALIQGSMIATSFEADKSAGSDENNIESEDRTVQILRNKLRTSGKYDEFIKEGLSQLESANVSPRKKKYDYTAEDGTLVKISSDNDIHFNKNVLKNAIKNSDKEELQSQILDLFVAGVWHSSDPEITRMHADAVIGTNNQFYNNQPVNTADAAIGSIVDIANLNAVKYLARASKIIKTDQARKWGRRFVEFGKKHPDAAFRYYGFKDGIHNTAVKLGESKFAQLVESGVVKSANAVSKTPIGMTIGSTVGASFGYDEGGYTGAVTGAIAGGALGTVTGMAGKYGLRKATKFIGVEDKISRAYQKTRAFATSVPSAILKAGSVAKTTANIATRMSLDTASVILPVSVNWLK